MSKIQLIWYLLAIFKVINTNGSSSEECNLIELLEESDYTPSGQTYVDPRDIEAVKQLIDRLQPLGQAVDNNYNYRITRREKRDVKKLMIRLGKIARQAGMNDNLAYLKQFSGKKFGFFWGRKTFGIFKHIKGIIHCGIAIITGGDCHNSKKKCKKRCIRKGGQGTDYYYYDYNT